MILEIDAILVVIGRHKDFPVDDYPFDASSTVRGMSPQVFGSTIHQLNESYELSLARKSLYIS